MMAVVVVAVVVVVVVRVFVIDKNFIGLVDGIGGIFAVINDRLCVVLLVSVTIVAAVDVRVVVMVVVAVAAQAIESNDEVGISIRGNIFVAIN